MRYVVVHAVTLSRHKTEAAARAAAAKVKLKNDDFVVMVDMGEKHEDGVRVPVQSNARTTRAKNSSVVAGRPPKRSRRKDGE